MATTPKDMTREVRLPTTQTQELAALLRYLTEEGVEFTATTTSGEWVVSILGVP